MEVRYIQMDYEEAINSKKDILNFQIDLIYTLRKITKYKELRKEEIALSDLLKSK